MNVFGIGSMIKSTLYVATLLFILFSYNIQIVLSETIIPKGAVDITPQERAACRSRGRNAACTVSGRQGQCIRSFGEISNSDGPMYCHITSKNDSEEKEEDQAASIPATQQDPLQPIEIPSESEDQNVCQSEGEPCLIGDVDGVCYRGEQGVGTLLCRETEDLIKGSVASSDSDIALKGADEKPVTFESFTNFPGIGRISNMCQLMESLWFLGFIVLFLGVIGSLLYGGFMYTSAGVNAAQVNQAKGVIQNAFIGLGLGLSIFIILNTIDPNLLSGNCEIPAISPNSYTKPSL